MTNKQRMMMRSLATLMAMIALPGVARADDMSDMRDRLNMLTAQMKAMQEQQTELLRRLTASEEARARLAQSTSAQPVVTSGAQPGNGQAGAPSSAPPGQLPGQSLATRVADGAPASAPPPKRPVPPQQVADAKALAAPPGTIAPNPLYRNQWLAPGKGVSLLVPGTDTTIRFGGLIKVDAFEDISGANLNGWPADAVSIPLNGTSQGRRKRSFSMTARQTRFNIGSETPTKFGDLRSFIEGDFYGTGGTALLTNSAGFRLRHAYLSLGNLLVGQTWSVFMDVEAAAETLDLSGPVGNAYAVRQPLIRYQTRLGQHGQLALGIENPEGDFLGADHTANIPVGSTLSTRVLNKIPDLTARYTYKTDAIRISAAGVVRYINIDTGGASLPFLGANGQSFSFAGKASTWGFGAQLDVTIPTWGNDSLTFEANGGPGIGRYVMGVQDEAFATGVAPNGSTNANPGNGAVLGRDGKLRTIFTVGGTAWYRHFWSKTLRSNVVLGYLHLSNPDGMLPINYPDEEATLHANLIWSPLPQVGFGVEYVRGYLGLRGQTDANRLLGIGSHGTMDRIQFSAQYNLF